MFPEVIVEILVEQRPVHIEEHMRDVAALQSSPDIMN
jgi:hypothetical protein